MDPATLPPLAGRNESNVREAIAFAKKHLSAIKRKSGDDYATHGLEVAMTLEEVAQDSSLCAVAILHDVLMHQDGEHLLHVSPLTKEERELVKEMHNLRNLHIDIKTDDLDQVINAFAHDPRLLLLRMAHRLNDVRHLNRFSPERQREIAHETLHLYTAISGRLGFQRWRWQMEDICFQALQPQIAHRMKKRFEEMRSIDEACLRHAHAHIERALKEAGIAADIDERVKGLYSTYRKMVLKDKNFEDLTDRLALRVLLASTEDCYRALGIIHQKMRPMHGKLKDYIGTPKENGYRSIHTVVYPLPGITELPIEIQIRTHAMHRECEYGIASHGEYKNWSYALESSESRANLFRNLETLHAVTKSNDTFAEALRHSFADKRLLVFDAHNMLYHLEKPSTALDFVQHAHPDIAQTVTAVRINGRVRPVDTPLRDGDIVEIVAQAEKHVSLR